MQNKGSSYAAWFFSENFAEAVRGGHEQITDEEGWEKQAEGSEDIDVKRSDTSILVLEFSMYYLWSVKWLPTRWQVDPLAAPVARVPFETFCGSLRNPELSDTTDLRAAELGLLSL